MGEPRSLDPAALSNTWAHQATLGNALYGSLMINNDETYELEYKMATDFSTTDGGKTFTLALQPDLKFSDGTPLDAAAVKFNWDRLKDPALGSTTIRQAVQIEATEVIDPATVRVTMVKPNPQFGQAVVAGALNWIASPAALEKGQQSFDENPIGAGPFTLANWMRQNAVELEKNPAYWDAPKPYLDGLTIRTVPDSNQRLNTMSTAAAELASETNWSNIHKAEDGGLSYLVSSTGGGQVAGMNFRRAPFDDERARRAVSLAIDLEAVNTVVYNGDGEIPRTLFPEDSPFYADIPIGETDSEEAQRLFDELAAEGKPVAFTFLSYPTTESRTLGEAIQAQLSAFENVEARVEVVDYAVATARAGARDFDMIVSSAITQDPDYGLTMAFDSKSTGNFLGVNDPELDAALDRGRFGESIEERKEAYEQVQQRIADLSIGLWYTRAVPGVIYGSDLNGVQLYTLGSPLPEEFWISN
ncbi:ABC transporter substrate-binding protein [Rhodococcus chondri]|uniref:ABC transporter substrate-binding protein n=1 Tax=Rhodococcus chondri TaxID=3065941 RepID=A0ABU7JMX3_9NOCA|nr:ABC transporter substrate-binding protein [Rhodococcus sp. CC-R104]MEE2030672.1 ABC transporter substrate-binding protein [Rhodococcus sp. CC-R104]